jgi:cytochrome c-type biogenesis protein CcmH/NrfF
MAQNKHCPKCDYVNLHNAKFCSECGHDLSKVIKLNSNKQMSKKPQSKSSSIGYPLLAFIGGFILLFVYLDNTEKEIPKQEIPLIQSSTQDVALERKVIEVASKFTCSCGSCGEEALETCTCNVAEQERNFIRQELQSGKSVSQAITAVKALYGHLKPEFSGEIEGGGPNLNFSGQQKNEIFSQLSRSDNNKIATTEDREEIFSHFECPCGQCGMPELRDCNCQHPKGATEVKLFVDMEIDYKKYTVSELVNIVDKKYGHKIR